MCIRSGNNAKSLLVLAVFLATALVGGCTTNISPEQRAHLDHTAKSMYGEVSMLLVDACVFREALGSEGDFIVKDSSIRAADAVVASLAAELKTRGNRISKTSRPFICGGLTDAQSVQIVDNLDGIPSPVSDLPIQVDNHFSADSLSVVKDLMDRIAEKASGSTFPMDMRLLPSDLATIREAAGVDKLWVVRVNGTDVTGAVAMTQGILTGLLTALLTGGAAAAVSTSADGMAYSVGVIDLEKGQALWAKSTSAVAADPHNTDTFDAAWAESAVLPLYQSTK